MRTKQSFPDVTNLYNLSTNEVTQAPLVQPGDQIVAHVDLHCFAFALLCKAVQTASPGQTARAAGGVSYKKH